jgi:hypothetical protein
VRSRSSVRACGPVVLLSRSLGPAVSLLTRLLSATRFSSFDSSSVVGVHASPVLESSDSRLEFSEFLIVLSGWFLGHARKMFGLILVVASDLLASCYASVVIPVT